MTLSHFIAVFTVGVVLSAAGLGLLVHLLWLALTDWAELAHVVGMLGEVIG